MQQRLQMKMVTAMLMFLVALVGTVSTASTIIKVPPIKPGEVNQTIHINIPPTLDVQRTVQLGNNTSAHIMVGRQLSPGTDCLLSDCDENDVACDGLEPCGPVCPAEACSRISCSQCWQSGFSGPCCKSCCSQFISYPERVQYTQQTYRWPVQVQQPIPLPYLQVQPQPIAISQPQPIPVPLPQPVAIPQPQPIPLPQPQPQPQPIPVPQPQPIPVFQPQPNLVPFPVPIPQPQPVPFPQPRPVPYPVPVPQPYAVPQPQPVPMPYPQPQIRMTQPQCRSIPWWPFLQCPSLPQVQPQPQPCYWYQPGCFQQIQQYPNLCNSLGPC